MHDKELFSCRGGYEPLKDSLVEKDVNMEFYEYDAEHDFANPSQPNFLRGACTLSVNRCCEFLKQHLSWHVVTFTIAIPWCVGWKKETGKSCIFLMGVDTCKK